MYTSMFIVTMVITNKISKVLYKPHCPGFWILSLSSAGTYSVGSNRQSYSLSPFGNQLYLLGTIE
jgi:hypothetical protein